jgi:hypothetical protein
VGGKLSMYYNINKTVLKRYLIKAVDLIKQGWCRGALARSKNNRETDVYNSDACKFCGLGAIYKVTAKNKNKCISTALHNLLNKKIEGLSCTLVAFNDSSKSKTRVIRLFEETISELQ